MKILDVGCGNAKTAHAIGIDSNPTTQADVIHDLNVYPWPIESNSFGECRKLSMLKVLFDACDVK